MHANSAKITENKELILNAEKTLLKTKRSGGNPVGLAAGALYSPCKQERAKISKGKIGETFRISERMVNIMR